jgi:hypothetical protein
LCERSTSEELYFFTGSSRCAASGSAHGWANQSKWVFNSRGRICAATKRKPKIVAEKHSAACGEAHERKIVGRALKRSGEIDGMASWWCKDRSRGSDDMNDVGLRQQ